MAGRIGNIANQLAQIATGFNAINDGPVLLAEQASSGRYVLDAIYETSLINGHTGELGMTRALAQWIEGEVKRLGRGRDWLTKAEVVVDYQLIESDQFMDDTPEYWTSQAFVARLSAAARVETEDGAASSSFKNVQAVAGKLADPVRPMPSRYAKDQASGGRTVEIKGNVGSQSSEKS
jgi:hypothetical protein